MISFDVKQLFTSIPTDLAVTSVLNDENIQLPHASLRKESALKLIKICLEKTIFQFENNLFK